MRANEERHTLRDILISGLSLTLLLLALASLHSGLRTESLRVVREASSSTVAGVFARAGDSTRLFLRSAWGQASEYEVFALFVASAAAVFVCMLKLKPGR
jgi:hypothetical protein